MGTTTVRNLDDIVFITADIRFCDATCDAGLDNVVYAFST